MSALAPLWRWRGFTIWIVLSTAAGIVGSSVPLLETLGYEYALLISLVVSLGAGFLSASYPGRVRNRLARFPGARHPAVVLAIRALTLGLLLLAFPLAIALLNGLRVPVCNLSEGLLFFLFLPVGSVVIATGVGLVAGLLCSRPLYAVILFLGVYLTTIAWAFIEFHATPAVYAFGPFFGYFPGVLYDELIQIEGRLVSYRAATLLQTLTLISVADLLIEPATLRIRFERARGQLRNWAIPLLLFACALAMSLAGPAMGHRTSRTDLESVLSRKLSTGRLDLFFSKTLRADLAEQLAADAAFSLAQVEGYFAAKSSHRIAVFVFADTAQKAAAMGASGTNVAKPWRNEVYITYRAPPHMVLRHELAHIVAASFGKGPFAVAGAFGGLVPNPGLIEGLAVAAGGPRGDLTPHQWTAAMKRLDLLPGVESLFGFGFFKLAAATAYTAAGSFSAWIHEKHGAAALKKAYSDGSFETALGTPLRTLAADWKLFLEQVPLEDADIAAAEHRFNRPSVIHSTCVHEVARLCKEASRLSGVGAHDDALEILTRAHKRSQGSTRTLRTLFFTLAQSGKTKEIRAMAKILIENDAISSVDRATIREIIADLDTAEGVLPNTGAVYEDLARTARDEATRRRLQTKAHLTRTAEKAETRLFDVLSVSRGSRFVSDALAALLISAARAEQPEDPILTYLLARQYFNNGDFDTTIRLVRFAEQRNLSETTASIWLAAKNMLAESLFHLERFADAQVIFQQIAGDRTVRLGARARADDWVKRCDFFSQNTLDLPGSKEKK